MKIKLFVHITLIQLALLSFSVELPAWDNERTHKDLSQFAAETSVLYGSNFNYMKTIGLSGLNDKFTWNNKIQSALLWLREGAFLEDAGSDLQGFLGTARYNNHFHNPLKPWGSAGLNDLYSGASSLFWAQYGSWQESYVGEDWSWQKIREHFYTALSGRDFKGNAKAATKGGREEYFAQTFRGLGHQMHLIQDMSQPDHVRNDAHPEDAMLGHSPLNGSAYFESWAKENFYNINSLKAFVPNPVLPSVPFNVSYNGFVPTTQLVDTNKYDGLNASAGVNQGLAEYANANFFSNDTIFASERYSPDHRHYFPYPKKTSTDFANFIAGTKPAEQFVDLDGNIESGTWISKISDGEAVGHLVKTGFWSRTIYGLVGEGELFYRSFYRDEKCHEDYAALLLPRAVGYSAGLLNYFFRGDIRLSYETGGDPGYVITNYSGEKLEGRFTLYYDNTADMRNPLWVGEGVLEAAKGDKTNAFDFIPPVDAKEPGKYILVFKGRMGNEDGAVAGYVFQRTLEISPPDRYAYAIMSAETDPLHFTEIKAKVSNTTGETIGGGSLQAVVKYKQTVDDEEFSYAISAPRAADLSGADLTFDFAGSPIPVDATDLYLQVVFKGRIGSDDNAVAIGLKDISEPTPIDLFNNTDRACVEGNWYFSGSEEAIKQIDANGNEVADEWDIYPHGIRDIHIRFSPATDPRTATAADYPVPIDHLAPGQFARVLYILADYRHKYSLYQSWYGVDGSDPWWHDYTATLYDGWAVENQTEYATDPAICGNEAFCFTTKYPQYYSYRGAEIWWGDGLIYVDRDYPPGTTCPGLVTRDQ